MARTELTRCAGTLATSLVAVVACVWTSGCLLGPPKAIGVDSGDAPCVPSADDPSWFADADGDGFGDPMAPLTQCDAADLRVADGTDCDDADPTVHPGAPELCDGLVNDCGADLPTGERDPDGDGFVACTIDVDGWDGDPLVVGGDDCDDADASVHPDAPERCDGLDNDCGADLPTDERDPDGDGFVACTIDVDGWDGDPLVVGGDDCDPADPAVYPDAPERCDGVDDDCDGDIDDAPVDGTTLHRDADGDGYGDPADAELRCEPPTDGSLVSDATDCDDGDPDVHPGAPELCDDVRNDCSDADWTTDNGRAWIVETSEHGPIRTDVTADLAGGTELAPLVYDVGDLAGRTLELCTGTYHLLLRATGEGTVGTIRGANLAGDDAECGDEVAGRTIVTSAGHDVIVSVTDGAALTVEDLDLTGGGGNASGGAAHAIGATLDLTRVRAYDNASVYGGAVGVAQPG